MTPLADAELTKGEIRALMHAFGLPMAEKPAGPCLSSRLMTGVAVTPEKLRHVEEMEAFLHGLGIREARVRLHEQAEGRFLRIEVGPTDMAKVAAAHAELAREGRARGYDRVVLDLAGYRMGGGTR